MEQIYTKYILYIIHITSNNTSNTLFTALKFIYIYIYIYIYVYIYIENSLEDHSGKNLILFVKLSSGTDDDISYESWSYEGPCKQDKTVKT